MEIKKSMDKFRLPRKIKKRIKKTMFLYPPDKDGSSIMAFPTRSEEDYAALKKGIIKKFPDITKAERKKRNDRLDNEIFVDDQTLRTYVDDIIREDLRNASYSTLVQAKNSTKAINAYFNFVNAYHFYKKGEESFGNICCMAIDKAKELLRSSKKR